MNFLNRIFLIFCCFYVLSISNALDFSDKEVKSREDILFNTMKIQTDLGVGSGFIFDFSSDNSNPCLITNKHVVHGANSGTLIFHCTDGKNYPLTLEKDFYKLFTYHPKNDIDLCYLPLSNYIGEIDKIFFGEYVKSGKYERDCRRGEREYKHERVIFKTLNKSHLTKKFSISESIQDILMFGYPIGLSDETNNLPIVRKGITASTVVTDFQGKSEILIDAACFPGSSGSPVFIFNGTLPNILGILYGGPQYTAEGLVISEKGNMVFEPIPIVHTRTNIPMNLGLIIKSSNLLNF